VGFRRRRIAADTSEHTIAGEAARSPEPQAQGVADKGERAIFFLQGVRYILCVAAGAALGSISRPGKDKQNNNNN
jgi:hypothetical protein